MQLSKTRQKYDETINWMKVLEDLYRSTNKEKDLFMVMIQRISLQHSLKIEGTDEALDQCQNMLQEIRSKKGTSGNCKIFLLFTGQEEISYE